jgi:hypothetical protein
VQLVDTVIKDGTDIYQHTTSAKGGIRKLIQLVAIGHNMIHVMPLAFALMARITEMPTNITYFASKKILFQKIAKCKVDF